MYLEGLLQLKIKELNLPAGREEIFSINLCTISVIIDPIAQPAASQKYKLLAM
jgi:hypothetical protein